MEWGQYVHDKMKEAEIKILLETIYVDDGRHIVSIIVMSVVLSIK